MSTQINDAIVPKPVDVPVAGPTWLLLRDYFAAHETLSDFTPEHEWSAALAVALSHPKPEGNWSTNPLEWYKWDAALRAEIKLIRADAMLKARKVKL